MQSQGPYPPGNQGYPPQNYPPQGYGPPPGYPQGYPPGPPPGAPQGPLPPKKPDSAALVPILALIVILLGLCGVCATQRNALPPPAVADDDGPEPTTPTATVPGGWRAPKAGCRLLAPEGLGAGAYTDLAGLWSCSSKGLDLSAGRVGGLANTLRFFAEGEAGPGRVERLKLFLNVNVPGEASGAQRRMADMAAVLVRRATGAELPLDAHQAVSAGKAGRWSAGGAQLVLEREVWPTGKGFSLRFIVQ